MEKLLIIGFAITSVAFIAYIAYDLKFAPEDAESATPTVPFASFDADAESRARSFKAAAYSSLDLILRQITSWDWQQAVANGIASLTVSGSELCEVRHSFPRQMVSGTSDRPLALTEEDLNLAVEGYQERTRRPSEEVWQNLYLQFKSFLSTRDSITEPNNMNGSVSTPVELRPRLREKLREVRNKYPFVNDAQPLHEDQLKKILDSEGIYLHTVDELPLLSLFVELPKKQDENRFAIVLRKRDVHQALREFLIAHELGHWFLHFESGFAEHVMGDSYYLHSSTEWKSLELDANTFAMTVLFPTPYLADRENYEGALTASKLLDDFTSQMTEKVKESHLRDNMLDYIGKRLGHYRHFKDVILPIRTPVKSIPEEDVDALLRLSENTDESQPVNWVQMNEDFVITRASQSFLDLFGRPKESIINKLKPLDLVVPEEQEPLRQRFLHRRDRLRAIFYFTTIVAREGKRRRVAVYSFPVLRQAKYVGSIGYLILPENIPADAFNPEAIHIT